MPPPHEARLRACLAELSDLASLTHLLRAVGQATWRAPFDTGDPAAAAATVLGGPTDCPWVGVVTSGDPAPLTTRLARRMDRQGRLHLVLVLSPRARTFALSVSMAPCPVLVISLDAPERTTVSTLARLRELQDTSGLHHALGAARLLDIQAVGQRFFRTFRTVLSSLRDTLPRRVPTTDRHTLALLTLTRVLFLYFLQARGWLDGRTRFLGEQVDATLARRGSLQDDLLHPLFFGTLNQPPPRRGQMARSFGLVPFLNGGLFEPHPLERQWRPRFPTSALQGAFDTLFERFHFTVAADDGRHIAPDMLGRVFEGVMDPEARAESGSYYTPAVLVQEVIRAGVEALLGRRLGLTASEAARRLDDPDPATCALLRGVRILDPAVGSGAFLLGALEFLWARHPSAGMAAGREILARNLWGVDINPGAVRLAELRLWLALVAGDPAEDPAEVAPLPNLDGMVRVGDSLREPPWHPGTGVRTKTVAALATDRAAFLVAVGAAKRDAARRLRTSERAVALEALQQQANVVHAQLRDLTALRGSPTLFESSRGLDRPQRQQLSALRQERARLHQVRRALERDEHLPWFDYRTHVADVFAERGGFDLVVGNPPWVRAEALAPATRSALAARYRWWTGGGTRGYRHQPDLSVAFLERAFELAAPEGGVAMLVPAKLATAAYATVARRAMVRDHTLHRVVDLQQDSRATFDATVYPMAVVATKGRQEADHVVRHALRGEQEGASPVSALASGPWILRGAIPRHLLEHLRTSHPTLGARFTPALGVKTGYNAAFLDPCAPLETELLRWAVRGRDVRAFRAEPRHHLLWTHDASGAPLRTLPPLASSWLGSHRAALRARRDWQGGAEWQLFRVTAATQPSRVVWADIAPRLEAVALASEETQRWIPLNTCYVMVTRSPEEAACLTAWLNSTPIRALAALVADPAAGGCRRFGARAVSGVPLPDGVLDDPVLAHLTRLGSDGHLEQAALDTACARHLALDQSALDALASLVPPPRHRGR